MTSSSRYQRPPRNENARMVPRQLGEGRVEVDATWGTVQPAELAPGVRTIGELKLIDHLERGLPAIDTRQERFVQQGTIPGARAICHEVILDHRHELDPGRPTVFFCNGPQCTATPDAVAKLLEAGYPPEAILYYRGGIHDWTTLGFPLATG